MTNPYASFLGESDAIAVMRETPSQLRKLTEQLGAEGLERSLEPGKWPAKTILMHLADCEIAFGFRMRQAMAETPYHVQTFDQDKWAAPYSSYNPHQALDVFTSIRGWNLAFLKTLTANDLERTVLHPERGEIKLKTMLETIAGHDKNHLKHLTDIAAL